MSMQFNWLFSFDTFETGYSNPFLESFEPTSKTLTDLLARFKPLNAAAQPRSFYFQINSITVSGKERKGLSFQNWYYKGGPQYKVIVKPTVGKTTYLGFSAAANWGVGPFLYIYGTGLATKTFNIESIGIQNSTARVYIELVIQNTETEKTAIAFVNGNELGRATVPVANDIYFGFGDDNYGGSFTTEMGWVLTDMYEGTTDVTAELIPFGDMIVEAQSVNVITNEESLGTFGAAQGTIIDELRIPMAPKIVDKTTGVLLAGGDVENIFKFPETTKTPLAASIRLNLASSAKEEQGISLNTLVNGVESETEVVRPGLISAGNYLIKNIMYVGELTPSAVSTFYFKTRVM